MTGRGRTSGVIPAHGVPCGLLDGEHAEASVALLTLGLACWHELDAPGVPVCAEHLMDLLYRGGSTTMPSHCPRCGDRDLLQVRSVAPAPIQPALVTGPEGLRALPGGTVLGDAVVQGLRGRHVMLRSQGGGWLVTGRTGFVFEDEISGFPLVLHHQPPSAS